MAERFKFRVAPAKRGYPVMQHRRLAREGHNHGDGVPQLSLTLREVWIRRFPYRGGLGKGPLSETRQSQFLSSLEGAEVPEGPTWAVYPAPGYPAIKREALIPAALGN